MTHAADSGRRMRCRWAGRRACPMPIAERASKMRAGDLKTRAANSTASGSKPSPRAKVFVIAGVGEGCLGN